MTTISQVAKRAKVSAATVSRVINGSTPVSDKRRARVLQAIEELGYQPNLLAASLRRGKTKTLGMILPDITNIFFAEIAPLLA